MIFEKIYDMDNLQAAWERVRVNKAAPGIDRVRCEDFEKNLALNLQKIQNQIEGEQYDPLPVVVFKDRKTKKEGRVIGMSTVRDKVVQQAILKAINPHFEKLFLPCSYAYRPKKSALTAVTKASQLIRAGNLWILQMDVRKFFDTMDHGILLDLVGCVIDEKPVIRLLAKLLKTKIFREMGLFDNVLGSQQGSGLSPLLSNIYLHPLDKILWDKYKDRYLRYSDDIAVCEEEKDRLEEACELIERCLQELKLVAHPEKTSIAHVSSGIVYLGFYMDIKGKGPDNKSVEQLQNKLTAYDKVRKTDNIADKLNDVTAVIRGWYGYYKTLKPVIPCNILSLLSVAKLSQEYGQVQFARQLLKQSMDFKHNHPQIAFHLAELFSSLGMENQAMREYAMALQLDPNLEKAKEKIRSLQEGEKNIHQSIEKIQLVLHHNPDYRQGYEKLVEHYTELGLYGFAEKAHQKVLELDDDTESVKPPPVQRDQKDSTSLDDFDYRGIDIDRFLDIFKGRTDAHAKQWVDEKGKWGFMRVERGLKTKDLYKHLKSDETLAIYPVTAKDTVYFIVFDVDTAKRSILEAKESDLQDFRKKAHQDILRIKTVCEQMSLTLYIEDSGYKGRHGWLFFNEEIPAAMAIQLGCDIMKKAGGPSQGMIWELFPMGKSERHKSLIKLPLGINRKNYRRGLFLNEEGHPVPDQALLLKTIRKNNTDDVQRFLKENNAGCNGGPATGDRDQELDVMPAGLAKMVDQCKVIKHLMTKAKDTNYLNHYERICLLYTLSFAGKEGCKLLHRVISYCINYDYHYTQRQIERRKESPISCAKIMENFPELAETLPCDCEFNLPPRSYPSPVLYLLEAEMESADMDSTLTNMLDAGEKSQVEPQDEEEAVEEDRILDFERIFSSECANAAAVNTSKDASEEFTEEGLAIYESTGQGEESNDIARIEKVKEPTESIEENSHMKGKNKEKMTDLEKWELALQYLKIRYKQKKVNQNFKEVVTKLENLFDEGNMEVIETEMGSLRRIRKEDEKFGWIFTTG
ncbi:MAG: CRISPR-associated primase-polymerase type A1 [Pseudomonadota bacterium]